MDGSEFLARFIWKECINHEVLIYCTTAHIFYDKEGFNRGDFDYWTPITGPPTT
jgi:hypothetical protein